VKVSGIFCAVMNSLILCLQADPGKLEAELPNGLIMGHAYSITGVKLVMCWRVSVCNAHRVVMDGIVLHFNIHSQK